MKNSLLMNATVASFEMGVEMSDSIPRLPMKTIGGARSASSPAEREFLLHAFYKLCRKRGRQSARCTFAKKQ